MRTARNEAGARFPDFRLGARDARVRHRVRRDCGQVVFSLAKEAVSARFPEVAKFVEKNYRYWLIAIFVVLFCSGGSALLLLLLVIL